MTVGEMLPFPPRGRLENSEEVEPAGMQQAPLWDKPCTWDFLLYVSLRRSLGFVLGTVSGLFPPKNNILADPGAVSNKVTPGPTSPSSEGQEHVTHTEAANQCRALEEQRATPTSLLLGASDPLGNGASTKRQNLSPRR